MLSGRHAAVGLVEGAIGGHDQKLSGLKFEGLPHHTNFASQNFGGQDVVVDVASTIELRKANLLDWNVTSNQLG
jgi:hypothetical protein